MQAHLFMLLGSSLVLAGHGYDFRGSPSGEARGDDDGGGLSMEWIVAVLLLALLTVAVLMWLNRREKESGDEDEGRALKLKSVAPVAFTVAVIAVPLVVWTASSGSEEKSLMVERWTSITGAPELLVSLGDDDLNTLKTTNGKKTVRLECRGRQGQAVLDARQKWPFIREPGYKYPHVHQPATSAQFQRADRCVLRGTRVPLEADVTGALKG